MKMTQVKRLILYITENKPFHLKYYFQRSATLKTMKSKMAQDKRTLSNFDRYLKESETNRSGTDGNEFSESDILSIDVYLGRDTFPLLFSDKNGILPTIRIDMQLKDKLTKVFFKFLIEFNKTLEVPFFNELIFIIHGREYRQQDIKDDETMAAYGVS